MASQPIYQFYAELKDYKPRIWRRFQVTRNMTMARLGYIIMTLFEMQASHFFCIDVMYRRNFYQPWLKSFPAEETEKLFQPSKTKETYRYEVQNEMTADFNDYEAENAVEVKISQTVSNNGDELDLAAFDLDDMNFRLKKIPKIYADIYESDLEPTEQSLNLLMRKYKK